MAEQIILFGNTTAFRITSIVSDVKVRFSSVLHHIFPNPEPDVRVRFRPPLKLEPEPRVQVRFRFEPSSNSYYYITTIAHDRS